MTTKASSKISGGKRAGKHPRTRSAAAAGPAGASVGAVDLDYSDTKRLTPGMAAAWDGAKRGRGRPRIGDGAEKVLISMERRLLLVTDALARRKGLDRSKLVALAIRQMLEREAETEATPVKGARGVTTAIGA